MGFALSKNEFPVNGRTVLITGGSSGMGLNVGRQLAEKGANIIIVARDVNKLKEGIAYISQGASSPETQRFHYISANLIDAAECANVVAQAIAWNSGMPPDVVWCCVGSCHPTLFIDTPLDQFQRMMDSNYFASVYMAHAALNAWLRPPAPPSSASTLPKESETLAGAGENSSNTTITTITKQSRPLPARHLIFTASFVSFYTFIGWSPYSPAKAALRSLSDALSQEMNLYAAAHPSAPCVRLHTVFPATMPTAGLEAENHVKTDVTRALEEGDTVLAPAEVARRSIAGLERGEELVATSFLIRLVMTGVLGGSTRGGLVKGFVDTVLSWVVVVVMVFVRGDMDRKVRRWGREHGASGMKMT